MYTGKDKTWMHYVNDIIAADVASAVFLSSHLRRTVRSYAHTNALEVLDMQRYKVFRTARKVKAAMGTRLGIPFVFLIGKN